jgi:hypothetical protein
MGERLKRGTILFILSAALMPIRGVQAQQQIAPPTAPAPSQIVSAKSVFLSNAGADGISYAALQRDGDPEGPYDQLYAALKTWGRYELVGAPSEADLVFEIRFTAPLIDCGKLAVYSPQLELRILDAKTHFLLWTIVAPVQSALRKATWEKNFSKGMASLLDDLKKLSGKPAT